MQDSHEIKYLFFLGLFTITGSIAGYIYNHQPSTTNKVINENPYEGYEEIEWMLQTCLTHQEQEEISGNILKYEAVKEMNYGLVSTAAKSIGLAELRSMLGFEPSGSWEHFWEPSEKEINDAETLEKYYYLVEPRFLELSLDTNFVPEIVMRNAVVFLDKRFSGIRNVYQRKFLEIKSQSDPRKMMNRKTIDRMIAEFERVATNVILSLFVMLDYSDPCFQGDTAF